MEQGRGKFNHRLPFALQGDGLGMMFPVSAACRRALSVPIESERRLYLIILTRFLHANRYPLRWKTL
jgi:hypothetical protein